MEQVFLLRAFIRSLSQTRSATESQAATLVNFTTNNGLQINAGAIGAYQGTLNPLSSISLFNTCVVPTLPSGSETWILTEQTIARLEMFQSQMGKRILKVPKHYADLLPRVTLLLPSMRVQILINKLHFSPGSPPYQQ